MGGVCCCLRDECEDLTNPNSSVYRNCICVRCFVQNFLAVVCFTLFSCLLKLLGDSSNSTSRFKLDSAQHKASLAGICSMAVLYEYTSLFRRGEEHVTTSSTQGTASLNSAASLDNSLDDMYRSPPRPLPYDADPRYLRLQRDGLVSRREKGSSHSHEEAEPLRRSEVGEESIPLRNTNKWNEFTCEEVCKEYDSKCSLKLSTAKLNRGFDHIYTSSEDEDVCPTCLEEYTPENPKIMTKCSHHFHLGCIYEWMERSDNCPVCGKEMAFDETP